MLFLLKNISALTKINKVLVRLSDFFLLNLWSNKC